MANDNIKKIIEALGDDPKALKAALQKEMETIGQLETDLNQAKQESEEAQDLLKEAHQELSTAPTTSGRPEFVVNKKTYVLVVAKSKVTLEGKVHEVNETSLKESQELREKLVKMGSGCLMLKSDLEPVKKEV